MKRRFLLSALALLLMLASTACGVSASSLTENEYANRQELVQEFINELETSIIPIKDEINLLMEHGLVVFSNEYGGATYNPELLGEFYNRYLDGDAQVTAAFKSSAFVVVRVVFRDGQGYYLRYQHDGRKEEGPLGVSVESIRSVDYLEDTDLDKIELSLRKDKADVATFRFKHPVDSEENGER